MVYVSLGARVLVNVEALNMVESVGNVTRHRRATVVYKRDGEYVIRVVPAVSGESLAHAYQSWVVDLAKREGLPLCEYCERCEFLKHCDPKLFGGKAWERELAAKVSKKGYDPHEVEKTIVANCVVEDVGGFLFPGATPVKRTSRFLVGYMVPAFDAIEKCAVEPQFHVRHSPSQAAGAQAQAQMIYYVEVGSAPYTFSFGIDVSGIGRTSMLKVEDAVSRDEREKRVRTAIRALGLMLDSRIFGAKLSRFNPVSRYEVVLATVSRDLPFTVSTPATRGFVADTLKRVEKFSEATGSEVKAFVTAPEDIGGEYLREAEGKAERLAGVLDLTEKVLETALGWLE